MPDRKPGFFRTEADLRRWPEANHETAPELLVGFWKKGRGKPSIDCPQARAMHSSPATAGAQSREAP